MERAKKTTTSRVTPFSDKDILTDTVSTLKSLVGLYNVYSTESSNEDLYDGVEQLRLEASEMQRKAFSILYGLGYYTLEPEETAKIQKAVTQFDNMRSQLSN